MSGLPIAPLPARLGGATSTGAVAAGASARTVSRKLPTAAPPESEAVTVTSRPSCSASVGTRTAPVAGSIDTPFPVTPKLSARPVNCEDRGLKLSDMGFPGWRPRAPPEGHAPGRRPGFRKASGGIGAAPRGLLAI